MRKIIFSASIVALLCASISFAGCTKIDDNLKGSEIKFAVSTESAPLTKTAYGADESVTAPAKPSFQFIDWVSGDKIRIVCAQADPTQSADYDISNAGHQGNKDKGSISSSSPLFWGTGSHTFYAVYPSPAMTGATSAISGHTITGSIPAVQTYGTVGSSVVIGLPERRIVPPDMKNQFMVAKATASEKASSVTLDMLPMTTALEFIITNGFDGDNSMTVSQVKLSSASKALNGNFSIDMDQDGVNGRKLCTTTATAAANGTVTINFSSPLVIGKGDELNFTFFLNPGNGGAAGINDITFSITAKSSADETTSFTRSAELKKDGVGVAFKTHQKTRLKGIVIPEAIEWDIEGDIVVTPWVTVGTQTIDIE